MSHECFHLPCKRVVPDNMLMCGQHWAQLPAELKSEIYSAYYAKQRGVEGAAERHYALIMEAQRRLSPDGAA